MSNITKGENSKSKEGRVVILVRNTSSCLQFYKVPSKYSEGYSSYRVDEKSISNKTKGDNSKSKKAKVVILIRDTSPGPVLHFYQSMDNHCQTFRVISAQRRFDPPPKLAETTQDETTQGRNDPEPCQT